MVETSVFMQDIYLFNDNGILNKLSHMSKNPIIDCYLVGI